jgi:hypothetical protein
MKNVFYFAIFVISIVKIRSALASYSDCGRTVSCFGSEAGCVDNGDCSMMVSYQVNLFIDINLFRQESFGFTLFWLVFIRLFLGGSILTANSSFANGKFRFSELLISVLIFITIFDVSVKGKIKLTQFLNELSMIFYYLVILQGGTNSIWGLTQSRFETNRALPWG